MQANSKNRFNVLEKLERIFNYLIHYLKKFLFLKLQLHLYKNDKNCIKMTKKGQKYEKFLRK